MIIVGIIGFIALAAYGTRYVMREQAVFNKANRDVVGILQDARSMEGISYPDSTDYDHYGLFDTDGDEILAHGYIVHFKQESPAVITLYADLYSSLQIGQIDERDQIIKTFELPENIIISAVAYRQSGSQNMDIDEKDFSVIYTTPNREFSVLNNELNSLQITLTQLDENYDSVRTRYVYMHYLYGIPESMDSSYFEGAGGEGGEGEGGGYQNSV
jgi:hypothetical protein